MSARPDWDAFYLSKHHALGSHPVFQRLTYMHVVEADRLLELGTGLGENISFLSSIGRYHGIEGSAAAVKHSREAHPNLRNRIVCGDFTKELPFDVGFDLIAERASLPHNELPDIERAIDLIWHALKPGGLFVSSDWFSTWHSEFVRGDKIGEATRTNYPDGQFRGVGTVHFSDEQELNRLFAKFERIHLEERCVRRVAAGCFMEQTMEWPWISKTFAGKDYRGAWWDIVVRRPL